jgi:molybdopterin converting factor small subunit
MMNIHIRTFAISTEIIGQKLMTIQVNSPMNIAELRTWLYEKYPDLNKLQTLRLAINDYYVEDSTQLTDEDQVYIIPPVSGG